ncbi:MAG: hypothetical protein OEZ68_17380 [Gammaproteobacteria bacterium]|nr:hypothetical protein [Gammaproteobacteria bacterium]MDH5802576.1 hypothetical protein [Gammaproteobacteria bacterium]
MELDLNKQDTEVLQDVLTSYLSDLRMEIADTDRQEFRDGLKSKKAVLIKILEELKKNSAH